MILSVDTGPNAEPKTKELNYKHVDFSIVTSMQ